MTPRPLFGEIVAIPLDQIDVTDRLRPVDPAHVEAIAHSIDLSGLQNAVILRPSGERYQLVAGGHRLAAVAQLGWTDVDARIENLTADEARLVEIDENLMRRELSALDRAIFLAERKAIYDVLHPETVKPGRRKKESRQTLPQFGETFTKHAAERTGLSERALRLSLELIKNLHPEARDALRLSDIADNQSQLLKLAALSPDQQIAAARAVSSGEAKTFKAARVAIGLDVIVEEDPQERLFRQFLGHWARMDAATRRRVEAHIASIKPRRTASKPEAT
jgi:ParB family chromosome partitioning protein